MRIVALALAVSLPLTAAAQAAPATAPAAAAPPSATALPPPPPPPGPAAKTAAAKPADPAKDLRANLRQKKSELIARNLALTPDQAAAFWPIYKRYDDEVARFQDENLALVKEYLAAHEKLDDATAQALTERLFVQQEKAIRMRRTAAAEVGKVLPAKLTAKFVQLDRYYSLLAEVQVQSKIPQIP